MDSTTQILTSNPNLPNDSNPDYSSGRVAAMILAA